MVADRFDQPTETCSDLLVDLYEFRFDESRIFRNPLHQFAYAMLLLLKRPMGLTRRDQELAGSSITILSSTVSLLASSTD